MPPYADPITTASGNAGGRAAAAFGRLAQSAQPRILLVTHGRGGGVARHVRELAALLSPGADALVLRPWLRSFVVLEGTGEHADARLWFHRDEDWAALTGMLRELGIARVHFHHVQGMPKRVLELGRDVDCPWDVTVHDYYPICPQYQLTDATGRYCGEPDEAGCTRCLDASPAQWPMGIVAWRTAFERLLAGAERVIAPSHDAAGRIARYFPSVTPRVWPHAESPRAAGATRKVLVLGGLSPAKGMALLEACARDARDRGLALRFRVAGHLAWPVDTDERLGISCTGEYREGTLAALLEQERGDAIFFPAQWPETYSYTLSTAIESGLPILATDLGAFRERLAGHAHARVLPWDAPPERLNDALLEMTASSFDRSGLRGGAAESVPGASRQDEWYRSRYLEGVVARGPASPAPRVGPPGRTVAPEEALPHATLKELFDDGVRCGSAGSLRELAERIARADREIEDAGALRSRLTATEERLREALSWDPAAARRPAAGHEAATGLAARAQATERSAADSGADTSWRVPAPLRRLVRFLRG